ncbi:GGDEF domain-containing protein [Aquabacterium sp.]|uniref:GGDEF domain-containing protein n=1 Tax=Aquabacterium sp. TaxID=1872578 RepID=UPI0035AF598B
MYQRLKEFVLSKDRKQQVRISRSLTAAYVFLACIGLQVYACESGFMDPAQAWPLSLVILANILFWYVVLRSGLNLRFSDPALTLPQVAAALTIIVGAYSVTGRIHGSVMMLLALVQVFGIFNMNLRDSRMAGAYTLALMGAAMIYKTATDPANYPYQVEIAHFILIAAILPTISTLAAQLSDMRARLQAQKNELAHALTRIQILATRDELTGLYNRRHMREVMAQHQKRLARSGYHRFCLALVDLDHFKRINDTHGHGIGDEVLKRFAAILQSALRETDVLARWGGEEFLVLMNDTTPEQANMGLERARAALADTPLIPSLPDLEVSFSAGLTAYLDIEPLDVCIERADRALYDAKRQGRHRTIIDLKGPGTDAPPKEAATAH